MSLCKAFSNNSPVCIKSLQEPDLLIKYAGETIKNEAKEKKLENQLENLLTSKGVKAKIPEKGVIRAGEGKFRAGEGMITSSKKF